MQFITTYDSPVGKITLSSNKECLTGLWIEGQKYFAGTLGEKYKEEKELPIFKQAAVWLDDYFQGHKPNFTPPLYLKGTPFRLSVWNLLMKIPYGETITYKDIAHEIARQKGLSKMSAQAIGGAIGHNPISIIIPCHRVIGTNGCLTGYAGGIANKIKLLELEGINTCHFTIPTQRIIL